MLVGSQFALVWKRGKYKARSPENMQKGRDWYVPDVLDSHQRLILEISNASFVQRSSDSDRSINLTPTTLKSFECHLKPGLDTSL